MKQRQDDSQQQQRVKVHISKSRFLVSIKLGVNKASVYQSKRHWNKKKAEPVVKLLDCFVDPNDPDIGMPYETPYCDVQDVIPYRNVLKGQDAATENRIPMVDDVKLFNESLRQAKRVVSAMPNTPKRLRTKKPPPPKQMLPGSSSQSMLSKIKRVQIGQFEVDVWYTAPYPLEYSAMLEKIFLCEHCLLYTSTDFELQRHRQKCKYKQNPPGKEIYREEESGKWSIFEVDGAVASIYCQNLCLLAKMFLNSKTVYHDVQSFYFYTLYENITLANGNGIVRTFVGYFSKEKKQTQYNLSCIMCLPTQQRKGYGQLLIDFSYLLSRQENIPGTPEKPLSELGLLSYRSYWRAATCFALQYFLNNDSSSLSIDQISRYTGMTSADVVYALERLEFLVITNSGNYGIQIDYSKMKSVLGKWNAKGHVQLNAHRLVWWPPVPEVPVDNNTISTAPTKQEEQDIVNISNGSSILPEGSTSNVPELDTEEDSSFLKKSRSLHRRHKSKPLLRSESPEDETIVTPNTATLKTEAVIVSKGTASKIRRTATGMKKVAEVSTGKNKAQEEDEDDDNDNDDDDDDDEDYDDDDEEAEENEDPEYVPEVEGEEDKEKINLTIQKQDSRLGTNIQIENIQEYSSRSQNLLGFSLGLQHEPNSIVSGTNSSGLKISRNEIINRIPAALSEGSYSINMNPSSTPIAASQYSGIDNLYSSVTSSMSRFQSQMSTNSLEAIFASTLPPPHQIPLSLPVSYQTPGLDNSAFQLPKVLSEIPLSQSAPTLAPSSTDMRHFPNSNGRRQFAKSTAEPTPDPDPLDEVFGPAGFTSIKSNLTYGKKRYQC